MFTCPVTFVSKLGVNSLLLETFSGQNLRVRLGGQAGTHPPFLPLSNPGHPDWTSVCSVHTGASRRDIPPRVFKRSIHKELRKICLSYSLVFCVLGRAVLIHLSSSHASIGSQAVSAQSKSLSVVLCKVGAGV